ncbi:hypothetical protein CGZ80_13015 [Rhodopirellula sp. MGV]|nr:hypothetical protein CGZ80_13015 [Rhodopirellula sp. MGV]PNY38163.1 hypothetical protein C2E31_03935 [Rhodopirellula baltica]
MRNGFNPKGLAEGCKAEGRCNSTHDIDAVPRDVVDMVEIGPPTATVWSSPTRPFAGAVECDANSDRADLSSFLAPNRAGKKSYPWTHRQRIAILRGSIQTDQISKHIKITLSGKS